MSARHGLGSFFLRLFGIGVCPMRASWVGLNLPRPPVAQNVPRPFAALVRGDDGNLHIRRFASAGEAGAASRHLEAPAYWSATS